MTFELQDLVRAKVAGQFLRDLCHNASVVAGWWGPHTPAGERQDIVEVRQRTKLGLLLVGTKICLAHSELSEGMEGHRKDRMDDKLPTRKMLEVELADAVIRICDLAGALNLDLGGAIGEKLAYNASREDHKLEVREAAGGKAY